MQIFRLLLPLLGEVGLTCVHAQRHPFYVRDDIEMWRFSSPHPEPSDPATSVAKTSPDSHYVAIVTTRGVLKTDLVESRISVFDLHEVAGFLRNSTMERPAPHVIASVTSYPHHVETEAYAPVIKDLLWSHDGRTLFFRSENMEGNYQLCMAHVDGSNFHCLTPASQTVDHFELVKDKIVFSAGDPSVHLVDPGRTINRDAIDVTGARLQEILFPNEVTAHSAALSIGSMYWTWLNLAIPSAEFPITLCSTSHYFPRSILSRLHRTGTVSSTSSPSPPFRSPGLTMQRSGSRTPSPHSEQWPSSLSCRQHPPASAIHPDRSEDREEDTFA